MSFLNLIGDFFTSMKEKLLGKKVGVRANSVLSMTLAEESVTTTDVAAAEAVAVTETVDPVVAAEAVAPVVAAEAVAAEAVAAEAVAPIAAEAVEAVAAEAVAVEAPVEVVADVTDISHRSKKKVSKSRKYTIEPVEEVVANVVVREAEADLEKVD